MVVMNSFSILVRERDNLFFSGLRLWWSSRELDVLHHLQVGLSWSGRLAFWTTSYNYPYFSKQRWGWLFYLPLQFLVLVILSKKILNFPCLMRFSICCFRLKRSSISCPWSLWKQQYLFLLCLLGSSFIFSSHFKEGSSLICMRTCSSNVFNGVYYWFRVKRPAFLLSRSFLSSIHPFFGWGPCLEWCVGFASILSALFHFLAMIASSAFIKFWAEWTSLAIDWGSFS